MDDLPYRAEYAKSGRASCKKCKGKIDKDDLRMAVMIQSTHFDGKVPNWFHLNCFFPRKQPIRTEEIGYFEQLRWEDQERIRAMLGNSGGDPAHPASAEVSKGKKSKGKKATGDVSAAAGGEVDLLDFCVEYSKSSRAKCVVCTEPLMKDLVRLGKKDYTSEISLRHGPMFRWYHIDCFVANRDELGYYEKADLLPGFKTLKSEDKAMLKEKLPKIKAPKRKAENGSGESPAVASASKKLKTDDGAKLEELKKKQNKMFYEAKDNLAKLSKSELELLLEHNNQSRAHGVNEMVDRLADLLVFGVPERCPVCKKGQLVFSSGVGYKCHGHLSEWARCSEVFDDPKKQPCSIPVELREKYPFLAKIKPKVRTRVFNKIDPASMNTAKHGASSANGGPAGLFNPKKPLTNWKIVMVGKFPDKKAIKKDVLDLGAEITSKCDMTVVIMVSTEEYFEKKSSKIKEAEQKEVAVVKPEFIAACRERQKPPIEFYKEFLLSDWKAEVESRIPTVNPQKSGGSVRSESVYTKSIPKSVKMKLKGGAAVDPDSGLEDRAHVYRQRGDLYSAVLGKTDLATGTNSYYKLQLLEADTGGHYWVFRSWGRIGTTIGGTKVEDFSSSLEDAKDQFEFQYEDKSGNAWCNRKSFQKVPGRFAPLEMHDDTDEVDKPMATLKTSSALKQEVEHLVRLIFDVQKMREAMLEFELDLQKMPLGKLSKNQIRGAYSVLSDALAALSLPENESSRNAKIMEASNKFYTMVPHDFGIDNPPPLNSEEIIRMKSEMLDNLLEIEVAYQMVSSADSTVDAYYKKLNTDMDVLDPSDPMFKTVSEYVTNTHAATHTQYKLRVKHVYTVKRNGEDKRYKPFKSLHNRQLLWHGSRLTNYAGILSQGLRIAPPEAPVTGYMFGKGIYFADMVSKSANYCFTTRSNPTGLLLLSEVALGDMHELKQASNIVRPPKGKHSVKGLGVTGPDPKGTEELPDGVVVPKGKPVATGVAHTSLLYNEYIVYDIAQVLIRYLVECEFVYA